MAYLNGSSPADGDTQLAAIAQPCGEAPTGTLPGSTVGAKAVNAGLALISQGIDYSWGGGGPGGPSRGFAQGAAYIGYDCSSFVQMAWYRATEGTVQLPRTAEAQRSSLPAVPLSQVQPGDLLFFGKPAHHVVMYAGNGAIIEAPRTGLKLRVREGVVQGNQVSGDFVSVCRPRTA